MNLISRSREKSTDNGFKNEENLNFTTKNKFQELKKNYLII